MTLAPCDLPRLEPAPSAEAAPAAAHFEPVPLTRDLSGSEALRRIGLACLDQLRRNEPSVL
ncbi:MAG TPA: hypothetical protein VJR70_04195, partial [Stellaceae bacterium]|nr:hypothetical protein [Stellaceae bacterium]